MLVLGSGVEVGPKGRDGDTEDSFDEDPVLLPLLRALMSVSNVCSRAIAVGSGVGTIAADAVDAGVSVGCIDGCGISSGTTTTESTSGFESVGATVA
jgi:hypothetical protein